MYREFWKLYIKGFGGLRKGLLICAVTVAVSLLEGFNIGLLVPLLENVQSPGQGDGHWVSRAFAGLFGGLGIPFSLGTILLGLAMLMLLAAGIKYLRTVIVVKTALAFVLWMKSRYMENLLNADMSYFHRQRLGVHTDSLTFQVTRAGASVQGITEIAAGAG